MKIGFIGLGNMATAMIGGMLQKGIAAPEDIIGSARTETTVEKVKTKFNINTTTDNKIVAAQADILFLAVKPIFFPEVIDQIKDVVTEDTLIVSIAAGRTLDYLKEAFGRPELKLIRCMPNTPALVLEGCGRKRHGGRHGAGTGTVTFLRHCQCGTGTADGCSRRCQR